MINDNNIKEYNEFLRINEDQLNQLYISVLESMAWSPEITFEKVTLQAFLSLGEMAVELK